MRFLPLFLLLVILAIPALCLAEASPWDTLYLSPVEFPRIGQLVGPGSVVTDLVFPSIRWFKAGLLCKGSDGGIYALVMVQQGKDTVAAVVLLADSSRANAFRMGFYDLPEDYRPPPAPVTFSEKWYFNSMLWKWVQSRPDPSRLAAMGGVPIENRTIQLTGSLAVLTPYEGPSPMLSRTIPRKSEISRLAEELVTFQRFDRHGLPRTPTAWTLVLSTVGWSALATTTYLVSAVPDHPNRDQAQESGLNKAVSGLFVALESVALLLAVGDLAWLSSNLVASAQSPERGVPESATLPKLQGTEFTLGPGTQVMGLGVKRTEWSFGLTARLGGYPDLSVRGLVGGRPTEDRGSASWGRSMRYADWDTSWADTLRDARHWSSGSAMTLQGQVGWSFVLSRRVMLRTWLGVGGILWTADLGRDDPGGPLLYRTHYSEFILTAPVSLEVVANPFSDLLVSGELNWHLAPQPQATRSAQLRVGWRF